MCNVIGCVGYYFNNDFSLLLVGLSLRRTTKNKNDGPQNEGRRTRIDVLVIFSPANHSPVISVIVIEVLSVTLEAHSIVVSVVVPIIMLMTLSIIVVIVSRQYLVDRCRDNTVSCRIRVNIRTDWIWNAHIGPEADQCYVLWNHERTVRRWKWHHIREIVRIECAGNIRDRYVERSLGLAKDIVI
jgi:hypothetical protein